MRVDHEALSGLMPRGEKPSGDAIREGSRGETGFPERLMDELRAYRDAAVYEDTRPESMRFRGWNMAKLAQARSKTEAAQGYEDRRLLRE